MSGTDLRKTVYYLKRNGLKKTWYAVRERLEERKQPPYVWVPPTGKELKEQRDKSETISNVTFSILTPAYRTDRKFLQELIDSLCCQTYGKWELILADATEDDSVERVVQGALDPRIRYLRLEENAGIAVNTNRALAFAAGEFVGLLDHDDVLTENALYEMAARIEEGRRQGIEPQMLYSDEDKCNGDRSQYFELNKKEDFNLDLLLSNNYICHFLVMKRELIADLGLRTEYDGAQDYDLVLRAAARLMDREGMVAHIPKVLYHWRCHTASTAENPQSKLYAYQAGRRAIQDFADQAGWKAVAEDTPHVGFYVLRYQGDIFASRHDIGAIGGRLMKKGRIVGGRMTREGKVVYENLPGNYSGYLHRAILPQDAVAVDIRNIRIREECLEIFRRVVGVAYQTVPGKGSFDVSLLPEGCDYVRISLELCDAITEAGYRILYQPLDNIDKV